MSTSTPGVGQPVTFDASGVECTPGPCSYHWQWFWRSADGTTHLGGQIGFTPIVTYVFDSLAASKPFVTVGLTVAQGRLGPRATYSASFVVAP